MRLKLVLVSNEIPHLVEMMSEIGYCVTFDALGDIVPG
jgi:hypothetical protein